MNAIHLEVWNANKEIDLFSRSIVVSGQCCTYLQTLGHVEDVAEFDTRFPALSQLAELTPF